MPLVIYWVESLARVLGTNILQTGIAPVFNLLLLIQAARMIVTLAKAQKGAHYLAFNTWSAAALGLLTVTVFCPTFVPVIVLSAYGDNATAVVLLALAFGLASYAGRGIRVHCLMLLLVLAVCLKEDNALQVMLILAAAGLWQWRIGEKFWRIMAQLALLAIPPLLMALLWHGYASHAIPGGEMAVRVLREWRPDLMGSIAKGFLITALHKSGYFVLALGLTGYALWRILRHYRQDVSTGMMSIMFAVLFIGYNAFLFYAYTSIFSPEEGARVASLWRYNTHLGLLEVAIAFLLIARLPWQKLGYHWALSVVVILCVVVAPLAFTDKLRFDRTPLRQAVDSIAQDLAHEVPNTSHIVLLDMNRNGFDCVIIDYALGKSGQVTLCMSQANPQTDLAAALAPVDYIWVDGWPEIAQKTLHQTLPADRAHLLKRAGKKGWKEIRSWPLLPEGK